MVKKLLLLSFISFFLLSSNAVPFVFAEEQATTHEAADITINASTDLGVDNAGTLPTSPFYFLKEWRRSLQRLFTFNSVAKAELELKITNEKAVEALKVQEQKPDDQSAIQRAIDNYKNNQERLKHKIESLKEDSNNPKVAQLIDRLDNLLLKHQELFNNIHDQARDENLDVRVEDIKDSLRDTEASAAEKDKDVKQRAGQAIKEAERLTGELQTKLTELNFRFEAKNTTAKIQALSTLLENAKNHLAKAKEAFSNKKYGEAFGLAKSATMEARSGLRMLEMIKKMEEQRETHSEKTGNKRVEGECLPRPACLDATPRCMIPEPAEGWCPK